MNILGVSTKISYIYSLLKSVYHILLEYFHLLLFDLFYDEKWIS
jgi:hypothetical protein